jgi:hypothetical protein
LQYRGARQHQIGAFRANARLLRPSGDIDRQKTVSDALTLRSGHPQPIDPSAIIAPKAQMKPRQAGDGAGCAY